MPLGDALDTQIRCNSVGTFFGFVCHEGSEMHTKGLLGLFRDILVAKVCTAFWWGWLRRLWRDRRLAESVLRASAAGHRGARRFVPSPPADCSLHTSSMVTTKPPTALLLTGQTGPQFYFSTLRLNTSSYREGISQQSANIKALMKQTHMPSGLQYNNFYLPFPCTKDKLLFAFADSKNRLKFLDLVIIKKVADHVKFLTSSTISKRKTRSTIPISPSPTMVTSFLSAPALEPSSRMLLHAMETPSTFKLQKFHWYETLCDHSGTHFTYAVSTCGMLTWTVSIYKLQLTVSIISCPRHCQPYHCTYTRIHPALLTTAPVCSLFYLPCFVGWQLHTQNTFPFQRGRNTVLQ
ncbi:hypothetical protein PCANC_09071 [Puccinia coronata f. sp. avenae]|uniref:Uncharacterized protein n=1 Tax=Puccinia coronata f. sp. avenae TaxID=200324 RepID=A0A2N5SWX5_9BASI|nr:hypothetical protein PCANC_09071 [Puccinia coronata f. sp. avenae]